MSTASPHPFPLDRPIAKLDEDKLGRRPFATSVARAIESWKGDASLVMALYGGWGDGKSSVKGMVVDVLRQDPDRCPIIIEFNPWEWAGQNQLAQVFFEEIGKQLGEEGLEQSIPEAKEAARKLRAWGKRLSMAATFSK